MDETAIRLLLEPGSRLYVRGRHYTVVGARDAGRDGFPEVRLLPDGRKKSHWSDWWPRQSLERMLRDGRALRSGAPDEIDRARDGAVIPTHERAKGGASMTRGQLTEADAAKAAGATAPLAGGKDEQTATLIGRYGEQWAKYKTGVRSSAPPNLGLSKETVDEVREAVNAALA